METPSSLPKPLVDAECADVTMAQLRTVRFETVNQTLTTEIGLPAVLVLQCPDGP